MRGYRSDCNPTLEDSSRTQTMSSVKDRKHDGEIDGDALGEMEGPAEGDDEVGDIDGDCVG